MGEELAEDGRTCIRMFFFRVSIISSIISDFLVNICLSAIAGTNYAGDESRPLDGGWRGPSYGSITAGGDISESEQVFLC